MRTIFVYSIVVLLYIYIYIYIWIYVHVRESYRNKCVIPACLHCHRVATSTSTITFKTVRGARQHSLTQYSSSFSSKHFRVFPGIEVSPLYLYGIIIRSSRSRAFINIQTYQVVFFSWQILMANLYSSSVSRFLFKFFGWWIVAGKVSVMNSSMTRRRGVSGALRVFDTSVNKNLLGV